MARDFICYHCLATYTGALPLGATTTCDRCRKEFAALQHLGHQEKCWKRRGGFFGLIADAAIAPRGASLLGFRLVCPACGKEEPCQHLGEVDHGQRVIGQRWHDYWTHFYFCRTCRVTWCWHGASEA